MGEDRKKDRDRDRDRHRSRSRSSSRPRDRSRSPKRDRDGGSRKRKSLFDIGGPPGGAPPVAAAAPVLPFAAPTGFSVPTAGFSAPATGFSAPTVGFSAPAFTPAPMAYTGAVPGFPNLAMAMGAPPSQQATRHARRVYVGGLPPTSNEQSIAAFFSQALAAVGGNSAGPGNAVVNVYINKEKNFSFVEFRTVEETSNAMALDGIMFEGVSVRVRRPNDYNPVAAAQLGPSAPNPALNLSAIGLGAAKADSGFLGGGGGGGFYSGARHDSDRVFVGGIPYYLTEDQCKELLGSFGVIKSFELIKEKDTGQSKGYGFVVYTDPSVTDVAVAGLNGLRMGERTLTVRRAERSAPPPGGLIANPLGAMAGAIPGAMPGGMPGGVGGMSTRIVVLQNAVTVEELGDDQEYKDIVDDMRDECSKYGNLKRVIIPRPTPNVLKPPGLSKVIVEYEDVGSALKARTAMNNRKFGGNTVIAGFLAEDTYMRGEFDAPTLG